MSSSQSDPAPRLFGTDGIRGEAGQPPLDSATVERLGESLAIVLLRHGYSGRVLLGRDTRASGPEIARDLASGLARRGLAVIHGGLLTTPAIAQLVLSQRLAAGVVISASHNPYQDNGIKVFAGDGYKLSDLLEREVEELMHRPPAAGDATSAGVDDEQQLFHEHYLEHLAASLPEPRALDGMSVVLDCGNGAASQLGPEAFARAGASVSSINDRPNGHNINAGCGALHPEQLAAEVLQRGAQLGAAFDGDADRVILVDDKGEVRDGDHMLGLLAPQRASEGGLGGDRVVGTVMSNIGLEQLLARHGLRLERAAVGDKYVLERMRQLGVTLGGEPSGHVIDTLHGTTGDGILTALRVAALVRRHQRPLSELTAELRKAPQILLNLRVARRTELTQLPSLNALITRTEHDFDRQGRIVVRFSGTEPLLRVMVEHHDHRTALSSAERIAEHAIGLLGCA